MDQEIRNKLRNVVTQCRKLLEDSISQELEGKYTIFAKKDQVTADPNAKMTNLTELEQAARRDILDHFVHIKARGFKPKDALDQLVREIAFTHLNRLCAYKMMEAREVFVGGQKFREAVSRGVNSNGVKFYLAEHGEDERLFNTGHQDAAYRHYLDWLGGALSDEIGVLFNPNDSGNRLYPRQKTLDDVLDLLNDGGIKAEEMELREKWPKIWLQDETIGWVYQYFTPKELRDQARKESSAPRNSYELAFRNQFFTPRYVVEFLSDNTLGRIWYEMHMGQSRLSESCQYLVRRPDEVFLAPSTCEGHEHFQEDCGTIAKLLLEGDESKFPAFSANDDAEIQRMISLSHCVSAYERLGDECQPVYEKQKAMMTSGDLKMVSTQDILDFLFLTCRSDRHGGDGSVYKELWFVAAANEVRCRALQGRQTAITQEQLLKCPVFVSYRPKKDPRELKILDPACGSGHFLLYCFDLLLTIYEEAYGDSDLGPTLQKDYPKLEDLRRDVPRLILAHNLHGIDIDLRASQIAALALWLRCQRAYQEMGLKQDRPKITRSNFVCAEPMPGEANMLKEFIAELEPTILGQLVEVVFDKMKLAGDAGSLLKIEDEIQGAVAEAKRQFEMGGLPMQQTLFDYPVEPNTKRFSVKGLTDSSFFEQAESKVIEALRQYAEKAQNGQRLRRQLFTEDAVRGFAFVDICHKRFDVVLMNPPFGEGSKLAKATIEKQYQRTKNDLYAAFVERGINRLDQRGLLGAITSRSGFFLSSFQKWREDILLKEAPPSVFADLGYGVLDTAMVETAAYCLVKGQENKTTTFHRLLQAEDKEAALRNAINTGNRGQAAAEIFQVDPDSFGKIPGSPFAYWVSERVRKLFTDLSTLESSDLLARRTNGTTNDGRWIRTWWEPSPWCVGKERGWVPHAKGGDYSPYYADLHLVIAWDDKIQTYPGYEGTPHRPDLRPASLQYFFAKGITWSRRSQRGLSLRALPKESIFGDKGPAIFSDLDDLCPILGITNSSAFHALVQLQMAFGSYEAGVLQRTPLPKLKVSDEQLLREHTSRCIHLKQALDTSQEVTHLFFLPALLHCPGETLSGRAKCWHERLSASRLEICERQALIDEIAFSSYEISACDRNELEKGLQRKSVDEEGGLEEESGEEENGDLFLAEHRSLVFDLVSYCVGVVFGRWDVRFATGDHSPPKLPNPFDPLPVCSPGMLQCDDGLPLTNAPEGYPFSIDRNGIIVEDPDYPEDIVHRVRDILELIWKKQAEVIEKEACELLGVKELRDYFRKPGKGGFWDDHIYRYSKSRRKAPIYWLLQSSKKSYSLWLYYHRLDKDLLFKALVNYVEPKIRLEISRNESLRGLLATAGETGKEAKRIAKEVERQEDFLSELRDFEDKLRRAANLHLEPNLNDGVILNIAPLHELVPWKEAKNYWEELLAGKYEWSTIGKQLREKELVKC